MLTTSVLIPMFSAFIAISGGYLEWKRRENEKIRIKRKINRWFIKYSSENAPQ